MDMNLRLASLRRFVLGNFCAILELVARAHPPKAGRYFSKTSNFRRVIMLKSAGGSLGTVFGPPCPANGLHIWQAPSCCVTAPLCKISDQPRSRTWSAGDRKNESCRHLGSLPSPARRSSVSPIPQYPGFSPRRTTLEGDTANVF